MGMEIGGNSFKVGIGIWGLDCESGERPVTVFGWWEIFNERQGEVPLVSSVSQIMIHLTCSERKRRQSFG